jgi:hypothetical protein
MYIIIKTEKRAHPRPDRGWALFAGVSLGTVLFDTLFDKHLIFEVIEKCVKKNRPQRHIFLPILVKVPNISNNFQNFL